MPSPSPLPGLLLELSLRGPCTRAACSRGEWPFVSLRFPHCLPFQHLAGLEERRKPSPAPLSSLPPAIAAQLSWVGGGSWSGERRAQPQRGCLSLGVRRAEGKLSLRCLLGCLWARARFSDVVRRCEEGPALESGHEVPTTGCPLVGSVSTSGRKRLSGSRRRSAHLW